LALLGILALLASHFDQLPFTLSAIIFWNAFTIRFQVIGKRTNLNFWISVCTQRQGHADWESNFLHGNYSRSSTNHPWYLLVSEILRVNELQRCIIAALRSV
jgi:hypothetical protein